MFARKAMAVLFVCAGIGLAHAGEVRFASVTGITGPNATTGAEGTALVTNFVQMINDKGGINGNTLVRVIKDDQYDPKKTAPLVEEAIAGDNVVALLNGVGTANTIAIMKSGVLNKHKVPLLGVFSGADAIRGPGSEMIFHTRAGYTEEVMKMARMVSTLGLKRVAVLYQDDGFGAGINQSIGKAAGDYAFEVVAGIPYKAGETDFSSQVKRIVDARPQAIFLMGVPDAVIRFMQAYDAPVGAAQIYTLSFVPAKLLTDAVGEKKVRGVGISQVVPNPNSMSLPLARDFQAFLKSSYGKGISSNPTNFEVYLNTRLLVEAIRMSGANPTAEKVTKALVSMNNYSLGGLPISFGETRRVGSQYVDIGVVGAGGRLSY